MKTWVFFALVAAVASRSLLVTYPAVLTDGYNAGISEKVFTLSAVDPRPVSVQAPVAPPVSNFPITPYQSRFHAQNEIGGYTFGFSGGPISRIENRDNLGIVRGSYNYIDSEGKVQTSQYVADGHGFRVAATNLPVVPESPFSRKSAPIALKAKPLKYSAKVSDIIENTPSKIITRQDIAFTKSLELDESSEEIDSETK